MRRLLQLGVALVVAGLFAGGLAVFFVPGPKGPSDTIEVLIRPGTPADSIAHELAERGVIRSPRLFLLAAELLGKTDQLKAGYYSFRAGSTVLEVVRTLASGKSRWVKVTVPEGLRSWEIASLLQRKIGVDSARFVRLVQSDSLVRALGCEGPSLEGYLFPETYYFAWGTPEEVVIRAMVRQCFAALDSSIRVRADSLGLSLHQVLTLASLIEGEAKVDSERVLISAVYHNRLRKGMKLEADPTVQYILGGKPRRLLKKDLEIPSPYNTYLHRGLPPGPVNNPGRRAIWAAVHPAKVDYLFFVANGEGGHYFGRTLAEHLRNKRHLDRLRRELAKRRRNRDR